MDIINIIAGLLILFLGGESVIRGSISLARHLNISRILVSCVIVGFGTSMPEMTVSIEAMIKEAPGIAIGNVVGSNIVNILFILGFAGMISPIILKDSVINRDIIVMLLATLIFVLLGATGVIGLASGVLMIGILGGYIGYSYFKDRTKFSEQDIKNIERDLGFVRNANLVMSFFICVVGFVLLIVGSSIMLDGSIALATKLKIDQEIIGLGIVAVGSCLPELATAGIAAYRKHSNIVVASIVGSNIFNILSIVGVISLIDSIKIPPHILKLDLWILLGITCIISAIFLKRITFGKKLGGLFVIAYIYYFYKLFI